MLTTHGAFAQRDADSKMNGDAYHVGSSGVYQQHAYENAQTLTYYAEQGNSVPKETIKAHAAQIRQNVDFSNKELAVLETKAKTDKTVAQHLTALKEHHAEALTACGMAEECAELDANSATLSKCCIDMATHLKAAKSEHDKLAKYLKVSPMPKVK
jgi:hypothetical protein